MIYRIMPLCWPNSPDASPFTPWPKALPRPRLLKPCAPICCKRNWR